MIADKHGDDKELGGMSGNVRDSQAMVRLSLARGATRFDDAAGRAIVAAVLLAAVIFGSAPRVSAAESLSWSAWVADLRREAIAGGIRPSVFDTVFSGLKPDPAILALESRQPERRLSYPEYLDARVNAARIRRGREELAQRSDLLKVLDGRYGVDPCVILAVWGMESSYGGFPGKYPVVTSLTTLAFGGTRRELFRRELLAALRILDDGIITRENFRGEWAGASGHSQFLPTSWQLYAVDYDGDGARDIWASIPDALASIANYLREHGWQAGRPWGFPVHLPPGLTAAYADPNRELPVHEWLGLGVLPAPAGDPDAFAADPATIVRLPGGPDLLAARNFRVLLSYNNSRFYGAAVAHLADRICERAALEGGGKNPR